MIAVDIKPINAISGVECIQCDIISELEILREKIQGSQI